MNNTLKLKNILLLIWPFIPILWACEKSPEVAPLILPAETDCGSDAIIDQELYEKSGSATVYIDSIEINGDCLWVRFASSGCNGESWNLDLIGSGFVYYSNPPQRNIRFVLENKELCEAHITKEKTFDISALRSEGEAMLLNVINSEQQLMYKH